MDLKFLKSPLLAFRFYADKDDTPLLTALKSNNFVMARYIIEHHQSAITKDDLSLGAYFLMPSEKYKEKQPDALNCLNALLETPLKDHVSPTALSSLLSAASAKHDLSTIKALLKFPQAVDIGKKGLDYNGLYYVLPENDPRRHQIDNRPSSSHTKEGSPEIVAFLEAFDKKCQTAKRKSLKAIPPKPPQSR